jgi:hypothetical protein
MGGSMDAKKIINEKWQYLYFFLLTVVVFAGFIFSSDMLFGSDTIEAGIFFRSFYANFVQTYHRIPLWNPYIFGGLPFVDAMHGDTFYPLAVLQFFMPLQKALGYKLVITVLLAGIFTYLYIRKMGMSKWAGVVAGTIYMLSGFLISLVYAGHDGRMYVTSILPLLLYTMEIGFQRKSLLWWWPFGLAFGLLILANHPQFAYFAMWCTGAYFLMRLIFVLKESKEAAPVKKAMPVVGFVLSMIFGLCLALVSIWPTQDYVRKYSPRAEEGKGYEYASSWSLHAEEAFTQIIPNFAGYSTLGNHPELSSDQTYWGKNYFKINTENAGLVGIILAVIGLILYRDRFSYFFLGTAIFALLYALGDSGIIFKLVYYVMPLVKKFRAPSTIMFLFAFSVAFLAARTIDWIEKSKKQQIGKNLLYGTFIAAGIYLLGALLIAGAGKSLMGIYTSIFYSDIQPGQQSNLETNLPNIAAGLLAGAVFIGAIATLLWAWTKKKMGINAIAVVILILIAFDSWILCGMKFIRPVDPSPYFTKPPIASMMPKESQPYRVFAMPQALSNQNILAQFGIDEVTGYHGNQLRWYDNFIGGNQLSSLFVYRNGRATGLSPNFNEVLSLTNAEYLLINQQIALPGFQAAGNAPGGLNIMKNTAVLPRVRVVRDYQVQSDPDKAMSQLMVPGFDYVNKIIIDRNPASSISSSVPNAGDTAYIENAPPDRIKLKANLSAPGFVAIQSNWYPYWKAFEGKTEIPIYRTDYTFMAIELPAGSHEVELRIENPYYTLGKNVSLISWLVLFGGLIAGAVITRRTKTSA